MRVRSVLQKSCGGRPCAAAFTLVEMAAVAGIVALLIGLIVPALIKAREQSRRATCMAHLQQLGMGMMLYAEDHDHRLPNSNPPFTSDDEEASSAVLVALNARYVKSAAMFHCPSDRDPAPNAIETADWDLPNSARVSFDFFSLYWMPEEGPILPRLHGAPLAWDIEGGRGTPGIRQNHGTDGGNVVFSDGHAAWQPRDDWDGKNWPNPANRFYR